MSSLNKLSTYANGLKDSELARYVDKIKIINSVDPFDAKLNEKDYPTCVTVGHVTHYLMTHVVPGAQYLKNSKSIEAFKKFQSGFIHSVNGGIFNDHFVIRGKVCI